MSGKKTVIITGASGGIGSGLVERFLAEGYNVVATSREPAQKLTSTGGLVVLDGEISNEHTASQAVEAAFSNFGSIDALVNNAGIFLNKPFTDFTTEDCDALFSTNLLGFFHITQRTVMITKGGLNSATQNLAIEYANDGIRFNAVAPGVVDTTHAPQSTEQLDYEAGHEEGDRKRYR